MHSRRLPVRLGDDMTLIGASPTPGMDTHHKLARLVAEVLAVRQAQV